MVEAAELPSALVVAATLVTSSSACTFTLLQLFLQHLVPLSLLHKAAVDVVLAILEVLEAQCHHLALGPDGLHQLHV